MMTANIHVACSRCVSNKARLVPVCRLESIAGILRGPFARRANFRLVAASFESHSQPPMWAADVSKALNSSEGILRHLHGLRHGVSEQDVDLCNFSVVDVDGPRPFFVGVLCNPGGIHYVFEKAPTVQQTRLLQDGCCSAEVWPSVFKLYCGSCRNHTWPDASELYMMPVGCAVGRRAMQALELAVLRCLAEALGRGRLQNACLRSTN